MPARTNRYYNDPALGAAFSNIAQMFKPPSGTETYAYAKARAAQEEAKRLADYYAYATGQGADPATAERMAIAAGRYNPTQSFQSIDMNNSAAAARNAADNRRALEQTRITDAGATTRTMLGPVAAGATRFVPPAVAGAYGVPQQQVGVIEAKPGERVVTPDNRVIEGAAKPLTMDEWKTKQAAALRESGAIPDEVMVNAIVGNGPVETIQTPEGPRISTRVGAIGQQPAPAVSTAARKDGVATLPDGRRVSVTRGPTDMAWKMADGTAVPPDVRIDEMARPQGDNAALGITTSNQTEATRLTASLDAAQYMVNNMREILRSNPNVAGLVGNFKGTMQSLASSVGQVARAFAEEAPDAKITLAEAKGLLDRVGGAYDPNIKRIQSGLFDLAYLRAQLSNSSGEVSRQAFERALDSLGQSTWSSQRDLETALAAFERDTIGAFRVKANALRGQQGAPATTGAPNAAGASSKFKILSVE